MMHTPLRPAAVQLHQELKEKIAIAIREPGVDQGRRLENAVYLSEDYLQSLYKLLPAEGFAAMSDEIAFFKSLKPLFAAEREYYQRCYHAHLMVYDDHVSHLQELGRMEKLLRIHADFADYYHQGLCCNDAQWFRQGQAPMPTTLCMWPWETEPRHTSERDGWVAGLIAVERYRDCLLTKISVC